MYNLNNRIQAATHLFPVSLMVSSLHVQSTAKDSLRAHACGLALRTVHSRRRRQIATDITTAAARARRRLAGNLPRQQRRRREISRTSSCQRRFCFIVERDWAYTVVVVGVPMRIARLIAADGMADSIIFVYGFSSLI